MPRVKKAAYLLLLMLLGSVVFSCATGPDHRYLFIAHTYQENPNRQAVDPRVEALNFSTYDLVLLGGDLTQTSTAEAQNLHYLDSVFGIRKPNVHWAIGNHDYMQPQLVPAFTGKPLFYTFHHQGITFLVLDSQRDACGLGAEQLSLFKAVTDTLDKSTHLIVMQHKLCWLYNHAELQAFEHDANADFGPEAWDTNPNNFHEVTANTFARLEKRGIDVVCISGDIGVRSSEFEYRTIEGIDFIASGLSRTGEPNDRVLELQHWPSEGRLQWMFKPI